MQSIDWNDGVEHPYQYRPGTLQSHQQLHHEIALRMWERGKMLYRWIAHGNGSYTVFRAESGLQRGNIPREVICTLRETDLPLGCLDMTVRKRLMLERLVDCVSRYELQDYQQKVWRLEQQTDSVFARFGSNKAWVDFTRYASSVMEYPTAVDLAAFSTLDLFLIDRTRCLELAIEERYAVAEPRTGCTVGTGATSAAAFELALENLSTHGLSKTILHVLKKVAAGEQSPRYRWWKEAPFTASPMYFVSAHRQAAARHAATVAGGSYV